MQTIEAYDGLRELLSRLVPRLFGHDGEIAVVHEREHVKTSYQTQVVTVELTSGEQRQVFLKNYGVYLLAKDQMEQRRQREVRVYRELLSDAILDTPQYYGCLWDESRGQFCMLLEFIDGTPAGYLDTEYWIKAANWLGRMHSWFAPQSQRLARSDFLLRHDEAELAAKAQIARQCVEAIYPELLPRIKAVIHDYDRIVEAMVRHPFTLVHGAYRAVNVMIAKPDANGRQRICGYDWEEAAYGSPLYDLAYLSDGFEPPALDQIFDSYRQGADGRYAAMMGEKDFKFVYECFRLHMIINMLSSAVVRRYGKQPVEKLVRRAEKRSKRVGEVR